MRRIFPAIVLLAALSSPALGQNVTPPLDSSKLAKPRAVSIARASWREGYFEHFDAAVRTLGLRPLREVQLAPGEREVRVWTQVEIGVPKHMMRLRDTGGRITGEGVMYWPAELPNTSRGEKAGESLHDIVAYNAAGSCSQIRTLGGMSACWTRYVQPPDWRAILADAESAGLWTIPDADDLPDDGIMTLDGWTIIVELRTHDSYRTYRYNSPDAHPKWPSAAQAIRIAESIARAEVLLMPPDAQKRYRGVTSGNYRSAIKLCGSDTTWEFADELPSAAKRSNVAMPADPGASAKEYYVEVTGIASPEWAAKQWESKFPRVLSLREVHLVKPWTGAECAK